MLCKICKVSELKLQKIYTKGLKNENLFGINLKVYRRKLYNCSCGHFYNIHNHTLFLENIYNKIYSKISHKDLNKKFNSIKSLKLKSSNLKRIKFLKKKIHKNSYILDIGSGFGIFPYEMKKNGFKIDASEINKDMINFIRTKKINCLFLNILKNNYKLKRKYNVITFNKVLEHVNLKNIKFILKKIKTYLEKNGLIYIEVPSATAATKGFDRQEFFFEHFNIFSKKSFKLLVEEIGYKISFLQDIKEVNNKYTIRAIIKPA